MLCVPIYFIYKMNNNVTGKQHTPTMTNGLSLMKATLFTFNIMCLVFLFHKEIHDKHECSTHLN